MVSATSGAAGDDGVVISPDEFRRRLDDLGNAYSAASSGLDEERSSRRRRTDDDAANANLARELAETKAELERLRVRLRESDARRLASGDALARKDAATNGVAAAAGVSSASPVASASTASAAAGAEASSPGTDQGLREENAVLRARLSSLESDLTHIVAKEKQELVLGILESLGGGGDDEEEGGAQGGGGGGDDGGGKQGGEEDSVASVLRRHVSPEDVLALARSQQQLQSVTAGGGGVDAAIPVLTDRWVPAILFAMGRYGTSRSVQSEGCSVLTDLLRCCADADEVARKAATSPASDQPTSSTIMWAVQEAVRDEGGLGGMVSAMDAFPLEESLQVDALVALRALSRNNRHNRDAVWEAGGVKSIVEALKNHLNGDPAVITEACSTLAVLAFENTNNKNAVRDAGGMTAIVAGMDGHRDVPEVQEAACLALWKLCFENPPNRDAIRDAGGVSSICLAMRRHIGVADVQRQACGALMNLCHQNPYNKDAVREAGGIETICVAMSMHPDDAYVQKHACGALNNLIGSSAIGTSANLKRLQDQKPERILVAAGKKFPNECGSLVRSVLKKI